MTKKINLDEVTNYFLDLREPGDAEIETTRDLVEAIVNLGNTDAVTLSYDDHRGLKSGLPEEFLATPLSEIKGEVKGKFEDEIKKILDIANPVIKIAERPEPEDTGEQN